MNCAAIQCQNNKHLKLGLCNKHYIKLRRYGTPNISKHDIKRKLVCKKYYCEVPLNNAEVALINHSDHKIVEKYNWTTYPTGYVYNNSRGKL